MYQIITPILIVPLLLFIILIPSIDDVPSLAQVAIGMSFGLWSMRQVIVPADIQWQTIIDDVFLFLYLALALAVLWRVVVIPLFQRSKAEVTQTAKTEATTDRQVQTVFLINTKHTTSSITFLIGLLITGMITLWQQDRRKK